MPPAVRPRTHLPSRRNASPAPSPPAPAPEPSGEVASALPRVLAALGSVVAPASLLTGLLLYFGRLHATGFCAYFGVSYTTLDLTGADFLVRSADGMIPPLVVAGAILLVWLWSRQLLENRFDDGVRRRLLRVALPVCAAGGIVLTALAVVDTVTYGVFVTVPELRGLSFSVGILLLAAAARIARADRPRLPPARVAMEWGTTFVLVAVGLFFAVGQYASGVGAGRGALLESRLGDQPEATLYSEKSLAISGPGVRTTLCRTPESSYRYRYDGLVLVLQSGGQYFLLPRSWTADTGAAVLLPRDDSTRLEFTAPGATRPSGC